MAEPTKSPSRVVVKAVLSYVNLFEPYIDPKRPTEKGKYKALLLIDKSNKADVKKIEAAIKYVEEKMITEKYAGKRPKKAIENTFNDGDEDKDGEEYEGRHYINVWKNVKPPIVDRRRNPITDAEEVYSGCVANVAIDFYYYFRDDAKGITASLEAVQKISDGEPLGASRVRADDVFEELEDEDEDEDDDDLD
jgi:hypothetical protein